MLDVDGASRQSCDQVDFRMVEEVVLLSLEPSVWLLLDLEDDVARLNARRLVSLSSEVNLVARVNTPINVYMEDLSLDNGLLPTAALAPILFADDLAFSVAVRADSLEPLDHRPHLAHHGLHTVAVAPGTLLDGTLLPATPITLRADDGLLQGELGDLASVDILQRDLVNVVDGAGLGRATLLHTTTTKHAAESRAAPKELREEVLGVHPASTTTAALQALLAILVIDLALLRV